jgi:hypothetical protein
MKSYLVQRITNGWLLCEKDHGDTFYKTIVELCDDLLKREQSKVREAPQGFRKGNVQVDVEEYLAGNNHPET